MTLNLQSGGRDDNNGADQYHVENCNVGDNGDKSNKWDNGDNGGNKVNHASMTLVTLVMMGIIAKVSGDSITQSPSVPG